MNSNPYIGIPNDYIRNLMPEMVDDMLRLVLDPVFPQAKVEPTDRKNKFDLIYSPGNTNNSEVAVNKRRPYELSILYPVKELQDETVTTRILTVKEYQQK